MFARGKIGNKILNKSQKEGWPNYNFSVNAFHSNGNYIVFFEFCYHISIKVSTITLRLIFPTPDSFILCLFSMGVVPISYYR